MGSASPHLRIVVFGLAVLAAAHGMFAWQMRDRRPELTVMDPPPSAQTRDILSFGDSQFLYRTWALDLQNDGDTGGRATPMGDYNYDYVLGWLEALRALDPRAQLHMFLAVRYFALTPDHGAIRKVIQFIVDDVDGAPAEKWYWLTQAVAISEMRLRDLPYALALARRIGAYDFPGMPNWVFMLPAVLLEKMERYAEARAAAQDVRDRMVDRMTEPERHWAAAFLSRLPN